MLFRHDPNTLWPTSLGDWIVILVIVLPLLAALTIPAVVELPTIDPATR